MPEGMVDGSDADWIKLASDPANVGRPLFWVRVDVDRVRVLGGPAGPAWPEWAVMLTPAKATELAVALVHAATALDGESVVKALWSDLLNDPSDHEAL